jgi:hypothetical protein
MTRAQSRAKVLAVFRAQVKICFVDEFLKLCTGLSGKADVGKEFRWEGADYVIIDYAKNIGVYTARVLL